MKKLFLLAAMGILAASLLAGCKTKSGSQEFIPGKGWVPISGVEMSAPPLS